MSCMWAHAAHTTVGRWRSEDSLREVLKTCLFPWEHLGGGDHHVSQDASLIHAGPHCGGEWFHLGDMELGMPVQVSFWTAIINFTGRHLHFLNLFSVLNTNLVTFLSDILN